MRILVCVVLATIAGAWSLPVAAQGGYGQVNCESRDNRYNECQANFRGRAELVRQTSRAACIEGQSYGYRNGRVWVDRGCAGVFAEAYYGGGIGAGGNARGISCESRSNRYNECSVGNWRGAQLVRQNSRAPCVEGSTWGFRRNAVWVNNGCAGVFAEGHGGGGGYDPYPPASGGQTVRCKSSGYEANYCPANARRTGVYLQRQISKAPCIEGRTWGNDGRGIWVSQGCEAEFRVEGRF